MIREIVAVAYLLSAIVAAALPARTIQLANEDTEITLEAGTEEPYLLELNQKNGLTWKGLTPEALIDHVESNGQLKAVHWKLNPAASQVEPTSVRLVYDSEAPR